MALLLCALCALGGEAAFAQTPAGWAWDFAAVPWCDAARQSDCVAWITLEGGTQNAASFAGAWAWSAISQPSGSSLTVGTPLLRYWRAIAAERDPAGAVREREIARSVPTGPSLAQTGQGTDLEISFDVATDPLCASATATDCVAQAMLQRAGADVQAAPFSAFTVTAGVAATLVPIASLPVGYGANDFVAVLDARAADGSLVRSDVSATVSVVRRPKAPSLRKN